MDRQEFIEKIASYVQKYAPAYGIKVCSPIIAQAVLESGCGTSNKVYKDGEWRHNYLGLKWRDGRCAISNDHFTEVTSEQLQDGSYIQKKDIFCKFKSMEECIIGYFQWTNISNYKNLKGVTDPETYLKNIKADGYASSINYVSKLMRVIENDNLTRFDTKEERGMIFNIHAGHNPDGKIACGAVGLIRESTEARNVKNEVIRQLQLLGHTVYDCTVDNGTGQGDVLSKIVSKCNSHTVDLDVSIHFNSGAKDPKGNGQTTGTECFIYSNSSTKARQYGEWICANISALGLKNRGVKVNPSLYYLKNTKAEAVLIECCFVDDADDVSRYNAFMVASAIVTAITGGQVLPAVEVPTDKEAAAPEAETPQGSSDALYRVQVGAFKTEEAAKIQMDKLKAAGFDAFITKA